MNRNTLRSSKFNIAVAPVENAGDFLLYNSATRALLTVDARTFRALSHLFTLDATSFSDSRQDPSLDCLPDEVLAALAAHGFLVDQGRDELLELRTAYDNERLDGRLYFTIALTLSCNFECPYCFETKRPGVMSLATANLVAEFVAAQAQAASARALFVNWFGGEPLLNLDVLVYLSKRIRNIAEHRGAAYGSYVVTNGSLLTSPVADRLVEAGVDRAQVTLDGTAQGHDQRRPFKGGRPSYEVIVSNLSSIRDTISIAVRMNVDQGNRSAIPALISDLARRGIFSGRKRVSVYASPVAQYNDRCKLLWESVPLPELSRLTDAVSQGLADCGFAQSSELTSPLFELGKGGCSAIQPHSFVIGPHGHLFKCEALVDDESNAVGRVGICGTDRQDSKGMPLSRLGAWSSFNPYDHPKCSACPVVPICKGGCPKNALEAGDLGLTATCRYWEANLPALIRQAAKERA